MICISLVCSRHSKSLDFTRRNIQSNLNIHSFSKLVTNGAYLQCQAANSSPFRIFLSLLKAMLMAGSYISSSATVVWGMQTKTQLLASDLSCTFPEMEQDWSHSQEMPTGDKSQHSEPFFPPWFAMDHGVEQQTSGRSLLERKMLYIIYSFLLGFLIYRARG